MLRFFQSNENPVWVWSLADNSHRLERGEVQQRHLNLSASEDLKTSQVCRTRICRTDQPELHPWRPCRFWGN